MSTPKVRCGAANLAHLAHNYYVDGPAGGWRYCDGQPVEGGTPIASPPAQRCGDLSIVDLTAVPPRRSCELPAGHGGWHEAAQLPFAPLRWVHGELGDSKIAAPAGEVVSVPPPADASERADDLTGASADAMDELAELIDEWDQSREGWRAIRSKAYDLHAAGVDEGRRQRDEEIHADVLNSARQVSREAGFGPGPDSVTVTYETVTAVLTEAYWKLRDHATALRSTEVYRKASERKEGTLGESPAFQRYRWLEAIARGIEDGARDLAEMLGVEEHEIELPEGRRRATEERTEEQHAAAVTVKGCLGLDPAHGKGDIHYWRCSTPGCAGHLCRLDGLPVHRG